MNGTDWRNEEEQKEFEAALRRALQPVDAPEGFAARLAALAEAEERTAAIRRAEARQQKPWWELPWGWKPAWGGMAAVLVAGVITGHVVSTHHGQVKASREFDVSMQITDKAMEHARDQLRKAGVGLDGEQ